MSSLMTQAFRRSGDFFESAIPVLISKLIYSTDDTGISVFCSFWIFINGAALRFDLTDFASYSPLFSTSSLHFSSSDAGFIQFPIQLSSVRARSF